jgi:hypothetical protein
VAKRPSVLLREGLITSRRWPACPWQFQVISLSGAAEKLLGVVPGPSGSISDKGMKTKVRRLYDIANVLSSLHLIDKVRGEGVSPKPVVHYCG